MNSLWKQLAALSSVSAGLIAGCASQPPSVTARQDQTFPSIVQAKDSFDSFGRRWEEAPTVLAASPVPTPQPTLTNQQGPAAQPAQAAQVVSSVKPVFAPVPELEAATGTCSGELRTGVVHLSKKVPAEVVLGKEYIAELNAVAVGCAENVVITDRIPKGASYVRSEPAALVEGDKLTWTLQEMSLGATKQVKVWLRAEQAGKLASCATIKADPAVCGEVRVIKADVQLTLTQAGNVTLCDPIPVALLVKNSGGTPLTGVKVNDNLPAGLSNEGRSALQFEAGSLAPGESREFRFNVTAASAGQFVNHASVVSDQGVLAEGSASTAVHQAVLTLSCKAPEQQYMGRSFDLCCTLNNTGDIPCAGSQLQVALPEGLTVKSATAGGRVAAGNLVWDVGEIGVNAPRDFCATVVCANGGEFAFDATAKGACAAPVRSACTTRVVGVAAILLEKSDNPDPVAIGTTTTYTVKITNQGSANDANVSMVVTIAPELIPVSCSGGGSIDGQVVTFPKTPVLAPKTTVTYQIVAKGVKAGDARTKFSLRSEMLQSPVPAEESTRVY